MPGDVGSFNFKAPKIQPFKEARSGGGKAVVQVLLKPHPAVGSQVWHSKSLALFKFGLKIPEKLQHVLSNYFSQCNNLALSKSRF